MTELPDNRRVDHSVVSEPDELENLWGEPFMGSDAVIRQRHRITGDLRMTNDQEMKGVQ